MTIENEKAVAIRNSEKLRESLPKNLSEKESKFFQQIVNAKTSPLRKLESLYNLTDDLYAFASRFTPCKKGCSSCCYYPVSISELEISYIEKVTKTKKNEVPIAARDFHGSPCPFLKNNACSIYSARPFACRKHIALTPTNTLCAPELANTQSLAKIRFSNIELAYGHIHAESSAPNLVDIRQAFGTGNPLL
jgi:Fe-S-cluster containining protein